MRENDLDVALGMLYRRAIRTPGMSSAATIVKATIDRAFVGQALSFQDVAIQVIENLWTLADSQFRAALDAAMTEQILEIRADGSCKVLREVKGFLADVAKEAAKGTVSAGQPVKKGED